MKSHTRRVCAEHELNPHNTQFSSQLSKYGGGSVGVADELNRGKLGVVGV